jgi:hypothetical protein
MSAFRKIFFIFLLFSWASISFGGMLDEESKGNIDAVDLNTRQIVINDWVYKLALDLKVHSSKGLETDFALKQGQAVTYGMDPASTQRNMQTITDIWLEK